MGGVRMRVLSMAGGATMRTLKLEPVKRAPRPRDGGGAPGPVLWPVDPHSAIETYLASPILRAISGLIQEALAGARVEWVLTEDDPTVYEAAQEKFHRVMWMWGGVPITWPEWVRLAVDSLESTGNAFVEVVRDGEERALNLLAPIYAVFEMRAMDEGVVPYLRYRPPAGYAELFLPPYAGEESGYLHTGYRTIYSILYGLPPWIAARDSVELDIAHRRYLRSFFANDATPRYLIHVRPTEEAGVNEEDAFTLAAHLQDFFRREAGAMAGRNLVVAYPNGLEVRIDPLAMHTQDPTYSALARQVMQEILMVRHMSMLHLGITEGGYRATASEQARSLVEYVLRPTAALITTLVSQAIYDDGTRIELVLDDRDSVIAMIEAATRAAGVPVLTPDEARALLGYEPRGDDALWRPANMVPDTE